MFTNKRTDWETPKDFYEKLNAEFHFTLDPASTDENAKCEKHYTEEQDGLAQDWTGETIYCNPPYGKAMDKWVKKCCEHAKSGGGTAVMLLPARTDTKLFHNVILPNATEIRFVKGRIKFVGSNSGAPFPSMIVVFKQVPKLPLLSFYEERNN